MEVGDKVKVIGQRVDEDNHCFTIGEYVKIKKIDKEEPIYYCENKKGAREYLYTSEFKPLKDMKVETTKENILKTHSEGCEDVKKALENLYPELFKDKVIHKVGNRYKGGLSNNEYILGNCGGNNLGLINLIDGGSYAGAFEVVDFNKLTISEWHNIRGGDEFKLIE